jgi:transcriptional regulator with XRE-family HTH domain
MTRPRAGKRQPVDYSRAFGARLRCLRLAAGLSQEKLAQSSNLDRTYVGGIERGERNPSLKNIVRLAASLKVSPAELFREWEPEGSP